MASRQTPPKLEVKFVDEKPAYRSGRELTGIVILDCHGAQLHVTRFFVECLGYSEVQESGQRRQRRDHLSIKQNLLSPHQTVLDSRRFDFKFRLPAALPPSIECDDVGFVRYCCRAAACPESGDPIETVVYFSLIEELDLGSQLVQRDWRPSEQASASNVQLIGGRSGKDEVKAGLVLTKRAYVPGENVECTLNVHCAACSLSADQESIQLVQTVAVVTENGRSSGPSRSQIIAQVQVQSDEQYSKHYWSARCQLHIPGAVASTLNTGNCQYPLSVSYAVKMSIGLTLAASAVREITVSCPVILGTVPLPDAVSKPHSASFVDVCRCVISDSEHGTVKEKLEKQSRNTSLIGQLMPSRRKSSFRMAPPIQYTLYCIYYPTISLLRKQKGTKSILKRHSVDNSLNEVGATANGEQEVLVSVVRNTSISLHETQL